MMNFDALTRCIEHEIRRRLTDRREVITRITRIYLAHGSLVLNLGHSPLYRHFYKCLYIEFDTFPRHDIVKASFALLIWLDGNAVKNFTCLLTIGILPIRFYLVAD